MSTTTTIAATTALRDAGMSSFALFGAGHVCLVAAAATPVIAADLRVRTGKQAAPPRDPLGAR